MGGRLAIQGGRLASMAVTPDVDATAATTADEDEESSPPTDSDESWTAVEAVQATPTAWGHS